jgi:cephalosporin-C deacetylase-like acetyl esterase
MWFMMLLFAISMPSQMVEGIIRYLERVTPSYIANATRSPERLRTVLGVVDQRVPFTALELIATTEHPALLADTRDFSVHRVRWPVLDGISAEGLYFKPKGTVRARVVTIQDVDRQPERFIENQELAASGVEVLSFAPLNQNSREFVYRMAFMVGRHVIGYEVQKALAAVDFFVAGEPRTKIGVFGAGLGGMIAQFAAEIDPRIDFAGVNGYWGPDRGLWKEPIDRNVWGILGVKQEAKNVQKGTSVAAFLRNFEIVFREPDPAYLQIYGPSQRHFRQFREIVDFSQRLARRSERVREKLHGDLPALRQMLWEEVLGRLPKPTMPLNARVEKRFSREKWDVFDVVYDVYPDVFGSGLLLLPKDIKVGERRPVVVAQHGLEGTPHHLIDPENKTYANIGARFADLGYVVYLPQNPYIGGDAFRQINRLANPLGLSMYSFIVAQQERALDWLTSLPYVDAKRIGFYGLSYGGKVALRIPPILERYAAVVCSGDFNEWIHKTTSVDAPYSYLFTKEWEMFEFNLAHVANHAEMAMMIAPRPFMVERGHRDGVGVDEWVAYEYAKVKRFYDEAGIGERTAIEYFNGPHRIHGVGTVEFLRKWLGR